MDKQLLGFVPRRSIFVGRSVLVLLCVRERMSTGSPGFLSLQRCQTAGSAGTAGWLEPCGTGTSLPWCKTWGWGSAQLGSPGSAGFPPLLLFVLFPSGLAAIPSLPIKPSWEDSKQTPELVHPEGQIKTKVSPGSLSQPRIGVQSWDIQR